MIELKKNFYSPATLAEELAEFASESIIRSQIKRGVLKARRIGSKNLIIFRDDIQTWLDELPSAQEPTNYHRSKAKRAPSRKTKTVRERAEDALASQRRRLAKQGKQK